MAARPASQAMRFHPRHLAAAGIGVAQPANKNTPIVTKGNDDPTLRNMKTRMRNLGEALKSNNITPKNKKQIAAELRNKTGRAKARMQTLEDAYWMAHAPAAAPPHGNNFTPINERLSKSWALPRRNEASESDLKNEIERIRPMNI